MTLKDLVDKYITSTEHVLQQMRKTDGSINLNAEEIEKAVNHVKDYLKDAKYYRDKGDFEVSLTSVAYCEGLLDALKLLGAVRFEWPARAEHESGK